MNLIALQNAARTYRDGNREIHALSGVTLSVEQAETVALLGKSGSGKSTLLHLIGGLERPSSGSVQVAGLDLQDLPERALTEFRLHQVGFVFQFFHLLPALTVRENLLFPAELAGRTTAWSRSRCEELAAAVGLEERLDTYPDRLSGGEQQRVAIARSLMLEPQLLLADEPTGNLDSETGARVLELLLGLTRTRGATLLLATHSPEVAALMGRHIELRDGRIAEDRPGSALSRDGAR